MHLKLPDLPGSVARDAMEAEDRLMKYGEAEWDPAKHPRTGEPPNPGWFAPTGGEGEEDARGAPVPGAGAAVTRLPSWLGGLSAAQLAELGLYAARIAVPVGGAAAVFGLLFIPSPNNVHVEGEVPEIPGLRYSWNRDETELHLTYTDANGRQRTFSAFLDGDVFRDEKGDVVGRVVGGNRVVIDTIAALPDVVKQDQPRLCPAHAPDVRGSDQGKPYDENRARQYEDYVKAFINPPPNGPTPSGYVYYLPNPSKNDKPVSFDDCQKATGSILFEIKGEGHAKLTNDLPGFMAENYISQATKQVAASGGRAVVWIFAEERAAIFARKLFDKIPDLQRITVGYVPWRKRGDNNDAN